MSDLTSHETPIFHIPIKFNPHSNPMKNHVNPTWLVGFTIFKNMSQLGLWLSHILWKNKIHVPNHQPDDNPIRQNTQLAIVQPAQPAALRLRPLWHHPRRQRPRRPALDVLPSAVWGDFWVQWWKPGENMEQTLVSGFNHLEKWWSSYIYIYMLHLYMIIYLVGGFSPSEKYQSMGRMTSHI